MWLVSPSGRAGAPAATQASTFRFYEARRSVVRAVQGVASVITNRVPFQCLLTAPYDWRGAIARAQRDAKSFDATVVVLARLHPWIRESVNDKSVLDAVDSLRRNAHERMKAATPISRWLWRDEESRMACVEDDAGKTYGRIVVVSDEESFGDSISITTGIMAAPLNGQPRASDFGFWGRLPYFANADAAQWLVDEIWPAIRARKPNATMVIGGAGASRALRDAAARAGITIVSPVDDMASFARSIRVALMPVRFGSGQSTKVVEAAEAGCAIVGTTQAFRGLAPLAAHARIEHDAESLARAAVALLDDDNARRSMSTRLRDVVEREYARESTLERFAAIAGLGGAQ